MFRKILAAIDNSAHSDAAARAAAALGAAFGAAVTGVHVYAARLHEQRFTLMEAGLPEKYREAGGLERQRSVHSTLIEKGLSVISESYLDRFDGFCAGAGIKGLRKTVEGRNHAALSREMAEGGYDLAVLGALGMGAVEGERIGSVAARVLRRATADVLVVRGEETFKGPVIVATDSSAWSVRAIELGADLAKAFGCRVEAVSVYDPFYHRAAFENISTALGADASRLFRFDEQKALHDEIIDRGMARLYRDCLDIAVERARSLGVEMGSTLLAGKPHREVVRRAEETGATLIIAGRHGIHRVDAAGDRIGGAAENIAASARCAVLIAGAVAGKS